MRRHTRIPGPFRVRGDHRTFPTLAGAISLAMTQAMRRDERRTQFPVLKGDTEVARIVRDRHGVVTVQAGRQA